MHVIKDRTDLGRQAACIISEPTALMWGSDTFHTQINDTTPHPLIVSMDGFREVIKQLSYSTSDFALNGDGKQGVRKMFDRIADDLLAGKLLDRIEASKLLRIMALVTTYKERFDDEERTQGNRDGDSERDTGARPEVLKSSP